MPNFYVQSSKTRQKTRERKEINIKWTHLQYSMRSMIVDNPLDKMVLFVRYNLGMV